MPRLDSQNRISQKSNFDPQISDFENSSESRIFKIFFLVSLIFGLWHTVQPLLALYLSFSFFFFGKSRQYSKASKPFTKKVTMSASTSSASSSSSTSVTPRASWNVEMEGFFLQLLCSQIRKGKRSANNFKTEAWKEVKERFNSKFGLHWELQQFKTKHSAVSILLKLIVPHL